MPISANRLDAQALSVEFVDASIRVILDDGREISAPLAWFPRLRDASDAQRANWRLIGSVRASIGQTSMKTCRSTHCWACRPKLGLPRKRPLKGGTNDALRTGA